ncbi:hypothetical protein [Sphingopyxis sp.]|jgi:hypothetical protein|uniref:hypothetical protein n=1 Tax=Sphingopyxis sp. TaxID=1908224 RepID=UPI002DF58906|nr:hypothetical protein [Sphingopyxis sp.]
MTDLIAYIVIGCAILMVGAVLHDPIGIFVDLCKQSREPAEEEAAQQERLARKIEIAEQAAAASARGEAFVPPADWAD